jgi:predicted metal-dependent hydrolase
MEKVNIDHIIRSRRRTFSLEINNRAELIVRAPIRASTQEIKKLVKEKMQWISKKRSEMMQRESQRKKRRYVDGEKFECLGKEYPLAIRDNSNYAFYFNGKELIVGTKYKPLIKDFLIFWYKKQAQKYINKKAAYYSNLMGIRYKKINITSAQTRWGSCSYTKNLNFSWRLVLAPTQIVNYVIVHELVHLIEMNHSERFWQNVAKIMPNYRIYESWLKENGYLLDL